MNLVGEKVFVTGAGGFIGSHLCDALIEVGSEVTAMIRYSSRSDWGSLEFLPEDKKNALNIVSGNIEDNDFLLRHMKGHSVVFHLAALIGIPYSYSAPLSYIRTNIEGSVNVIESARRLDLQKIIHTSTSEVYGTAQYTPIDEKHALQGQSPYSASKIGADKIVESYYRSFASPVVTVRPFNTFGPRQSARAIIPTIICQALERDEIHLGSLDPARDLTYVKDTVQGFIKAAITDEAVGEVMNIGSGSSITIGKLADRILSLMQCDKPIITDEQRIRPGNSEVYELICDNSKSREMIGWEAQRILDEGLLETINFISENRSFYKADKYTV